VARQAAKPTRPDQILGFREAIFAQPENLTAARKAAREVLAGHDLEPLRRGVLVLTGMGASWHALAPAVRALRRGGRRAFAVHPSELVDAGARDVGDCYVVVSQSGASAETLAVLEHLDGAFVAAISARRESPLAEAADLWLPLGPVADTPVATLSYTATLQALGLLCDALTATPHAANWDQLPDLVLQTLQGSDADAEATADRLHGIHALDAIGSGASQASVGETALLAREGLLIPATGYETRQYLHGPLEAVGSGLGCILFGSGRARSLATSLVSYGASVALVTDAPSGARGISTLVRPPAPETAAPILEIVPVQLIVSRLAERLGLTHRQRPVEQHEELMIDGRLA
jgi:glucosamine--fructose-6-phosphate aminotransferase (isomerizing)